LIIVYDELEKRPATSVGRFFVQISCRTGALNLSENPNFCILGVDLVAKHYYIVECS
jgi:hypothetical protein